MAIDKKTVLILGAGASYPYGFPLGRELVNKMMLSGEAPYSHMMQIGFREDEIRYFCKVLRNSAPLSIDRFLEDNLTFANIGHTRIVMELFSKENTDSLMTPNRIDGWYQMLFHSMYRKRRLNGVENLSILTFNYDRSLEHYIKTAMKSHSGIDGDLDDYELLLKNIYHVYGVIADDAISYGGPQIPGNIGHPAWSEYKEVIATSATRIRLIDDARKDFEHLAPLRTKLEQAQRVAIIGFGFDKTNTELFAKWINLKADIHILAYQNTEKEMKNIMKMFPKRDLGWSMTTESQGDITSFLRKYPILD